MDIDRETAKRIWSDREAVAASEDYRALRDAAKVLGLDDEEVDRVIREHGKRR